MNHKVKDSDDLVKDVVAILGHSIIRPRFSIAERTLACVTDPSRRMGGFHQLWASAEQKHAFMTQGHGWSLIVSRPYVEEMPETGTAVEIFVQDLNVLTRDILQELVKELIQDDQS
jgi:hypothetical protein